MNPYIPLKTSLEVARMKKAGKIAEGILRDAAAIVNPGISTGAIDDFCRKKIAEYGAVSSLLNYKEYPAVSCVSVNNVAAHGLPGDYILVDGDIVSIDISLNYNGWHGDSAWTFNVGKGSPDIRRLTKAAWKATMAGISQASAGGRMGDIGAAIETVAASLGCRILEKFVGHGIGINLHEEPMVLNTGKAGTGIPIVPGMVFTIEPILSLGKADVKVLDDGWSIVTRDGSFCAQYEHTVAIFSNRTEVLTYSGNSLKKHLDFPPFF